eukprot:4590371-Heterocapsa_arctica.AAC.1
MLIAPIINADAPTTANVISMMLMSVRLLKLEVRTILLKSKFYALLLCLPPSGTVSTVRIVTPVSGSSLAPSLAYQCCDTDYLT